MLIISNLRAGLETAGFEALRQWPKRCAFMAGCNTLLYLPVPEGVSSLSSRSSKSPEECQATATTRLRLASRVRWIRTIPKGASRTSSACPRRGQPHDLRVEGRAVRGHRHRRPAPARALERGEGCPAF